jgi:transposase
MKTKLFIGIDVSKSWIDVTILNPLDPKKSVYQRFDNNQKGFAAMIKWIKSSQKLDSYELIFCLEHTGIYSFYVCEYLTQNNYFTWVENPLQIKRSMGIKRAKNDKIDSLEIAKYAYRFADRARAFKMPTKLIQDLHNLEALRTRLVKAKVSLEISSKELNDSDMNSFIRDKTKAIVDEIKQKITEVEKKIKDLIQQDEEVNKQYKLCLSVPGIGPQTAIMLIIFTKCFTTFNNVRQLACYCGMAPFEQTSGSSIKTRPRVSNLANKKLKTLLHAGATSLLNNNAETKQFYERKRKEGKHHNCIMNIIRYKMLNHVMAVINRGSVFMPTVEYQNLKKAA